MKKNVHEKSREKKLACLNEWMNEWTWWTIWNLYFGWINKERKDSYQKGTSSACVHTRFLISLHTPER